MERNGLPGRINYSNDEVGMLGFDIPLLQSTQPQNPPIQHQMNQQQLMASSHNPQHHLQQHEQQTTNFVSYNNLNPNSNSNSNSNMSQNKCHKTKTQFTNSSEDEPSSANDHENSSFNGKRKMGSNMSQWQRMKWTDDMVRLLILAVYYIGDEASNEVGPEKKKPGSGGTPGGSGLLQKKGKWKSVSREMMEKGFIVSPQQCEDKFNDLNKRYKRVNDVLGKGTACNVVENQALLETMDLAPKMKDEVRKLLNSKHLFFKEMCAYHNSCGHGGGSTSTSDAKVQHNPHQSHQQSCAHSGGIQPSSIEHYDSHKDEDRDDDDDDDDEDDEEEEGDEENGDMYAEGGGPRKRARADGLMSMNSQALQQFNGEVMGILQDASKSAWEKKQWMKMQLVKLEEQGVNFQYEALELEKQKFKWLKFSSKKEREMEKLKIENERKRLLNERMLLLVKQKEIDLLGERNDPSCVTS